MATKTVPVDSTIESLPSRRLPRVVSSLYYRDSKMMRAAVFPRIVWASGQKDGGRPSRAFTLVSRMWSGRIRELQEYGLTATASKFKKAFYCPPPTFKLRRRTQPCEFSRVCPFCYMRDAVRPAWASVQSLRSETKDFNSRFRLIDCSEQLQMPNCDAAAAVSELRRCKRQHKLRFSKLAGRVFVATLEPANEGYMLTLRNMLIVDIADMDAVFAKFNGKHGKLICRESPLTDEALKRSIVRTCRYPIGLLTGSTELAVAVLNELQSKKVRSIEFSGILRGRSTHGWSHPEVW